MYVFMYVCFYFFHSFHVSIYAHPLGKKTSRISTERFFYWRSIRKKRTKIEKEEIRFPLPILTKEDDRSVGAERTFVDIWWKCPWRTSFYSFEYHFIVRKKNDHLFFQIVQRKRIGWEPKREGWRPSVSRIRGNSKRIVWVNCNVLFKVQKRTIP